MCLVTLLRRRWAPTGDGGLAPLSVRANGTELRTAGQHWRRGPLLGPGLPALVLDRTQTPSTTNPLGVKGVGEAGAIASTPAVVGAVIDALRPLGVTDVEMPCTSQRVWQAIDAAKGGTR